MENLSSILSSSLDSQHSGEGGPVAPSRQAMILEGSSGVVGPRGRDLANLADMVCSVRKPFADATSEVGSGLTSHSYPSTKAPGSDETASSLRRRQQQHHSHRDEAGSERVEDYDDDELTDEDSDNLLSDEEDDDGESGFLSQM